MRITFPKDTERMQWTRHIKNKMLFYGLSEQRIRGILNAPDRKEEGVAPQTAAAMKRSTTKKKPEEIWIMYRKIAHNEKRMTNDKKSYKSKVMHYKSGTKFLMISAWRYPGITKPGSAVPIPEDVLEEMAKEEG